MKQYLIALALMLSLNAAHAGVQPRHRHHPQAEQSSATPQNLPAVAATPADSAAAEALEAYSDTTDAPIAGSVDTTYTSAGWDDHSYGSDKIEDFFMNVLGGTIGVGGVILAIVIVLAVLLCLLAPFIVVILLIRYFINNHNKQVQLAEKAMETGQPIPSEIMPQTQDSPDYYKKKGIKNIAIGIGLALMFSLWDADALAGVGLLVACWGIGQLVIAKMTK